MKEYIYYSVLYRLQQERNRANEKFSSCYTKQLHRFFRKVQELATEELSKLEQEGEDKIVEELESHKPQVIVGMYDSGREAGLQEAIDTIQERKEDER